MIHCLASHCIRNLHVMVLKTKTKGQTKYVVCIKEKEQVQNCHTEPSLILSVITWQKMTVLL